MQNNVSPPQLQSSHSRQPFSVMYKLEEKHSVESCVDSHAIALMYNLDVGSD